MTTPRAFHRPLLCAVAAAVLAGCGGGDSSPEPRSQVAGADARRHAMANLTAAELTTLFDWAEYKFPDLFPKPSVRWPALFSFAGESYWVSAYETAAQRNYLGITPDGRVFGYGSFVNNFAGPVFIGNSSAYTSLVQADRCKVYPNASGCTTNPPASGSVNECTLPASQALRVGNRVTLNYQKVEWTYVVGQPDGVTSEYSVDSVVDSVVTFEGKEAYRSTTTTNQGGVNLRVFTYAQVGPGDVQRTLGNLIEGFSGATVTDKYLYVYNSPAPLETEFTLSPGGSWTSDASGVMTTLLVGGQALDMKTNFTERLTHTFVRREVKNGYDTCLYRVTTAGQPSSDYEEVAFIVGKGVPAFSENYQGGRIVLRTQLKSGTFLGAPL